MSPIGPVAVVLLGALAPVPPETAKRPPTPAEFAAAVKAYEALGGSGQKFGGGDDRVYHGFMLFKPTADACGKLPDLPFAHRLTLFIGPDTPPGALTRLGRLGNLRWVEVELGRDDRGRQPTPADLTARVLELAAVPNLERLSLYGSSRVPLTDELAEKLVGFKALRSLVGEGPITDAGLAALARHPTIDHLLFQSCPEITDAGLARLATMPNLRSLGLQDCPKPTAAGLRPLAAEPRLTFLAIGGKGMDGSALEEVAKVGTLERLNLTTFREDAAGRQLAALGRLPRLRELRAGDVGVDDEALAGLAAAAGLEVLHARRAAAVTDVGLKDLAKLKNLKVVSLVGADQITDAGLGELAALPRLETVYLIGAKKVTDVVVKALAAAPSLTGLYLHETTVTEAGVRAVVAPRGERLRMLGVPGIDVGDDFVAFVAATAPNLKRIDMQGCKRLTEKCLPVLEAMPDLRGAGLDRTDIPRPALEAFWKRLRERE